MNHNFKKYILFWLSGSVSQLGSAMTSYALILWSYTRTGSAMSVSLMSFFNYLPYIAVSVFAGSFVDRRSKKKIMLASDSLAAACSLAVLFFSLVGSLQMQHIYLVNAMIGLMNAFQSPAQSIAVGMLVPKEKLGQASGMDSFSSNLVTVIAPVLASALFAFGGLECVIALDLVSFLVNFSVLLLFIRLPEAPKGAKAYGTKTGGAGKGAAHGGFAGMLEGFRFLRGQRGLLYIMLTMALLNFFSRMTYENILSPMILARSGGNERTLGLVNAVLGAGGILGGILADYVFEPFMQSGAPAAKWLEGLVGSGTASGMAVMFLCTGMLGFLASMLTGRSRWVRELEEVKTV